MHPNDIEEISVDAVRKEVRKHPLLQSYIADKDKEPSWDGHIYCYSEESKKKSSLTARIPVQVKGKAIKKFDVKNFKYSIDLSDVTNYQSEDGCLYIVVQIIDNDNFKIFYKELLPVDMKNIFKALKKTDQLTYSIDMSVLNAKKRSLQSVCEDFIRHRNLQKGKEFIDIDQVGASSNFTTIISLEADQDPLRYFSENEVYLYHEVNEDLLIPLAEKVKINALESINMRSFQAEDFVITRTLSRSIDKGEMIWHIGENIKIMRSKITFNLISNIKEQIEDIKFLLKLILSKKMMIDKVEIRFIVENDSKEFISKLQDIEMYLVEITETLKILEIDIEEFKENFQREDYLKLEKIEKAINGQEALSKSSGFMNMSLSDGYYLFFISVGKESTEIMNIMSEKFLKRIRVSGTIITSADNPELNIVSPYFATATKELISINNFNMELVFNSIKKTIDSLNQKDQIDSMLGLVNVMVLEILRIYDKTNKEHQLEFACLLAKLCHENNPADSIYLINLLQIYKRQRVLTNEEKLLVRKIDDNPGIIFSLAKSILLENSGDIEFYYNALTDKERDEFKKQPLYNLLTISSSIPFTIEKI